MILNHLWGLYAHPKEEWETIDQRHEKVPYSLSHICLIALIPSICGYIASTELGWSIGVGEPFKLTQVSAATLAFLMYFAFLGGTLAMAYITHELAKSFDSDPTYTQSLEVIAYTTTPLYMSGAAALYPELWFITLIGLLGLTYAIYLLYMGIPVIMHIPEGKGFIYSTSVVTAGLILLVTLFVCIAFLWNLGLGPVYSS